MERVKWLDTARGLGIILVVIGHYRSDLTFTIYSFHMPLFFIISGLLHLQSNDSLLVFIKKKCRNLLFPYFTLSLLLFFFWLFLSRDVGEKQDSSIVNNFAGIFYATGGAKFMEWGTQMWFIPCLFLTSLSFEVIHKFLTTSWVIVLLIALYISTFFFPETFFRLPWGLDILPIGLIFFVIGHLFRTIILKEYSRIVTGLVALFSLLILFWSLQYNYKTDLLQLKFGNGLWFFVSAISGSSMILFLSKYIGDNFVFGFIGANTLIILAFHLVVRSVFYGLIMFIFNIEVPYSYEVWQVLFLSTIQILLLLPIIMMTNKYFQFLLKYPF